MSYFRSAKKAITCEITAFVVPVGFEPTTPRLRVGCSNQIELREPINKFLFQKTLQRYFFFFTFQFFSQFFLAIPKTKHHLFSP